MGYVTHADGEIAIVPPLTFDEFEDSPFLPENAERTGRSAGRDVKFRIETELVRTPEGLLSRQMAVAVVETWEDEPRNYNIVEHLQELVDRHGEGREFVGRFDMEGEDSSDIWRLKVVNGRATRFDPVVTWPEESECGEVA